MTLVVGLLVSTVAMAPPPPQGTMPQGQGAPPPAPPPVTQPNNQPSAAPTTDPAMLARAKSWFAQLQAGKIDRSQLADKANSTLTDANISNAQSVIGNLGTPVSFVQQQAGSQGNINYAVYMLTFKNGKKINFFFAVDTQGKIEGLQLGQPQ